MLFVLYFKHHTIFFGTIKCFFNSKIPLYHDIKNIIDQKKHSVYDEPTPKCEIKIIILFFLEKNKTQPNFSPCKA